MIIDKDLPLGLIANTAGVLGMSIGKFASDLIGEDVVDQCQKIHKGITTVPIPILKATKEEIFQIQTKIREEFDSELLMIDFSNVAQSCITYADYTQKAAKTHQDEYCYLGIALLGDKRKVNQLTGNLPLLR